MDAVLGHVFPGECSGLVLVGTSLLADQEALLLAFVRRFGGRIDAEFSDETTHVITKASAATKYLLPGRPLKYFYAILQGKWVLSFEWMSRCLQHNAKVDEKPFQVQGDQVALGAPEKGRRAVDAKRPPLFAGLSFSFHSDFDFQGRTRLGCELLINWGGGAVLGALPSAASSSSSSSVAHERLRSSSARRTFLITRADLADVDDTLVAQCVARGVEVVDHRTLLDCVSCFDTRKLLV